MLFIAFIHTNNLDIEKRGGGTAGGMYFLKIFTFFFFFALKIRKEEKSLGAEMGQFTFRQKI